MIAGSRMKVTEMAKNQRVVLMSLDVPPAAGT
jgi:hypothetical protein